MIPLCTAGYEGHSVDEFVDLLLEHEIEVVIDVRELPVSRKKGFSKVAFSAKLAEAGLDYVHFQEVGNPKSYRHALRSGLDFADFAKAFRQLLQSRQEAVAALGRVALLRRVCLLCFEADPGRCHRSLVADFVVEIADDVMEVVHLGRDR